MLAFAKQTTSMPVSAFSPETTPSLVSPQSTETSASECKKPRKNRSAYTLFSLDVKPRIKASTNSKMSCVELQTTISQLWKDLSNEERKKYQDQANEEKLHYMLKLKKFYENASPETLEEANKPKPKRPYSAYCYFVKEIRHVIKLPDAKFKMQEILKQASEKWRMLTEEEKAVYHEKARQARENYGSEPIDAELEKIQEEALESAEVVETKAPKKKTQEKGSKASSTNKKRGLHFPKEIREKMEKLEKQSPVKKVKTDLFGDKESNVDFAARSKIGLNLESLLAQPKNAGQEEKTEVKQESMEQEMLKPLPIKVQPSQPWTGFAPNMSLPQLSMPGLNANVNIMMAMGFEQARRQLMNQLLMRQIGQMALQQNLPTAMGNNIEVKAESL